MKRALPISIGLVWALSALTVVARPSVPHARPRVVQPQPRTEPRPPLVVVRALGPVPESMLRLACRTLLAAYPVRCEIRERRSMSPVMASWSESRAQLDARAALEVMFRDRTDDAAAEINITNVDIYESGKPYVFGLASLTDRVAIVSLARIDGNRKRLPKRMGKLVLHEAGHAMGLHHHDHRDCVMRQDPTPGSLDHAPDRLCDACHRLLVSQVAQLGKPGQLALDRARSHLVRGEVDAAREYLVQTLWSGELDFDVLNGFGMAFFEARSFNDAISVLEYVTKHRPEHAEAHVNLGLAYQMRAADGDRRLAILHFQRALELRPGWELVAEHLAGLQDRNENVAQGPR